MTLQTLKIAGREFVIVSKRDFERLQRQASRGGGDDVAVSLRRLNDPREKRIPWQRLKKRAGLT